MLNRAIILAPSLEDQIVKDRTLVKFYISSKTDLRLQLLKQLIAEEFGLDPDQSEIMDLWLVIANASEVDTLDLLRLTSGTNKKK